MPKNDRIVPIVVGLAAAFLAAFAIGLWVGETDSLYGDPNTHTEERGYSDAEVDSPVVVRPPVSGPRSYQQICADPQSNSDADLCQQWRSANAARDMSRLAIWQLGLSIMGVVGLVITVYLSNKAANAATEGIRAYLTCTGGTFILADSHMAFDVKLRNAGNSTAKNVSIRAHAIFARPGGVAPELTIQTTETGETSAIEGNTDGEVTILWVSIENVITNDFIAGTAYLDIIASRAHFNVDCHLSWEDTFGRPHKARFALFPDEDLSVVGPVRREGSFRAVYAKYTGDGEA